MFATIISRILFYYAYHAGALDAEDVAQDVIVNILQHPPRIQTNARGYLRASVSHELASRWRRSKPTRPLNPLVTPCLQNDDARADVACLMATEPGLVGWLVDYSERTNRGSTDRVNALRGRRKLRDILDETVTTCAGCGANRLCREYEGLWLCLSGPWHCWRHRKAIHANKRNEAKEDK